MADSFSLSLAAVDILSQALRVNTRQFPLEIPSFGQLQEDRRRIAKAVFNDLIKRGLIRHGDLDPDLTRALRTMSEYRVAVAAMGLIEQGKELFARGSADADTGVVAVREGQLLRLELIRPTGLAMAMVGLLPVAEGGPGQSVNVTKPAPVAPRRDDEADYFGQVRAPARTDPAMRIVESYLSRPRTGSGFFVVTGRDRNGKEVRAGELGWTDTDAGRYLNLSRPPGEDGQIHGTVSPADMARLTHHLGQLIESAAYAR